MMSQRTSIGSMVGRRGWPPGRGAAVGVAVLLSALVAGQARAQDATIITGRVTATVGTPLANVYVSIPGFGAATKDDGRYTFTVPASRAAGRTVVLTARVLGYKQAEVPITLTAGTITQNFALAVNPLNLGTVVVTGEGTTQKTEQLGTSYSPVDSLAIQKSNEQNVIASLAAKAPGVAVTTSSGEPGTSTYIQLRGLTTLTAADGQPLIVVDGLPIDNSVSEVPGFAPGDLGASNNGATAPNRALDINPDDIESVEILKGPAAAALYGSRGGQGVILITTKRGRSGQTSYSAKSSTSFDNASHLPYLQRRYANGSHGVTFSCAGVINCHAPSGSWGDTLATGTPTYDHANDIFTTGHVYDNALTASGGNEKTTFYLSGAYSYNRGIITGPNNSYGRTSLRFNGSHQVTPDLRLGTNAEFAQSNGNYVASRNNVSSLLLGDWRSPPEWNNKPCLNPVSGEPQSYRFQNPGFNTDLASRVYDNPFCVANYQRNTSNVSRTFGNVTADYSLFPWLKFNEALGGDYSNDERLTGFPYGSATTSLDGVTAPGSVTQGYVRNFSIDQRITATASYSFTKDVDASLTIGNDENVKQYNTLATTGNTLIAPYPFQLTNTATQNVPNEFTSTVRLASFFGQAQVDLWKQLSLTGRVSYDGASTFGSNNLFSDPFPGGTIAWNVIREDVNSNPIITSAKLRVAYGESGTQPLPYVLGSVLTTGSFGDGFIGNGISTSQNGVGGFVTSTIAPNPNLKSERQKEWEFGTDFAFLKNIGDASVTYYRENTVGAIFAVPVSASTGYQLQYQNAANLWNHGWEVSLNLRPITTKDFAWDLGLNWARNRSDVTKLPPGVTAVSLGGTGGLGGVDGAAVVGSQVGAYYGTDFVRCGRGSNVGGVNIDQTAGQCLGAKKGALYISSSGYPILDTQKNYITGDPNRNWIGSIHTAVHFHKLSVSALLDIQNGGESYNGTNGALNQFGKSWDTYYYRKYSSGVVFGSTYMPGPVSGPGANQNVKLDQGWFQGAGGVFNGPGSYFIQHSGFAKLREISVSYLLDGPWVQRAIAFSSITLRVSGRNLRTWTDYTGVDPETSILGSASPVRGIDYFNLPQTQSFILTVTLNR
jgi:TonB-linked SusC/RagA family outer membrane protein